MGFPNKTHWVLWVCAKVSEPWLYHLCTEYCRKVCHVGIIWFLDDVNNIVRFACWICCNAAVVSFCHYESVSSCCCPLRADCMNRPIRKGGMWGMKTPPKPKIYQKGPHSLHKQNPRQLYHAIIVGPISLQLTALVCLIVYWVNRCVYCLNCT